MEGDVLIWLGFGIGLMVGAVVAWLMYQWGFDDGYWWNEAHLDTQRHREKA